MRFADALAATLDFVPEQRDNVTKNLPLACIDEALADAGVATLRKRRLPMQQVVWLALGIALMRNRDIEDVLHKLDLAGPSRSGKPMAPSSISEARQHLGAKPMELLFAASASRWGHSENAKFEWHMCQCEKLGGGWRGRGEFLGRSDLSKPATAGLWWPAG